jgi:hypothetical protein
VLPCPYGAVPDGRGMAVEGCSGASPAPIAAASLLHAPILRPSGSDRLHRWRADQLHFRDGGGRIPWQGLGVQARYSRTCMGPGLHGSGSGWLLTMCVVWRRSTGEVPCPPCFVKIGSGAKCFPTRPCASTTRVRFTFRIRPFINVLFGTEAMCSLRRNMWPLAPSEACLSQTAGPTVLAPLAGGARALARGGGPSCDPGITSGPTTLAPTAAVRRGDALGHTSDEPPA